MVSTCAGGRCLRAGANRHYTPLDMTSMMASPRDCARGRGRSSCAAPPTSIAAMPRCSIAATRRLRQIFRQDRRRHELRLDRRICPSTRPATASSAYGRPMRCHGPMRGTRKAMAQCRRRNPPYGVSMRRRASDFGQATTHVPNEGLNELPRHRLADNSRC